MIKLLNVINGALQNLLSSFDNVLNQVCGLVMNVFSVGIRVALFMMLYQLANTDVPELLKSMFN